MRVHLSSCGLALALLFGCAPRTLSPKRPSTVPPGATWAEGADGGGWIDCQKLAADTTRFDCSIYHGVTGALHARGTFIPNFAAVKLPFHYRAYDGGGRITLSDTTRLQADGLVDFPSGGGHGMKSTYHAGEPVGPESAY